jgi:hypothetical protein
VALFNSNFSLLSSRTGSQLGKPIALRIAVAMRIVDHVASLAAGRAG